MLDERLRHYRLLIADVFELAGTSRATSEKLAADVGQTAARWHVLSVVSDAPCATPAIARRLGLTRQSVRRVVADLIDEGLVSLQPNPAHSRSSLVAITASGERLVEELFARSRASRLAVLERADVTVDELAAARRVVQALTAALSDQ